MNTKTTSFNFDKEFLSCVRYYMPDREKWIFRIQQLFLVFRDEDLCRIEDSKKVLSFKRDILAIVARYQREAFRDYEKFDSPYAFDGSACRCCHDIVEYLDGWWNCGATVEFGGMY